MYFRMICSSICLSFCSGTMFYIARHLIEDIVLHPGMKNDCCLKHSHQDKVIQSFSSIP